ncbi:MAG TPA: pantoate--beta-alanine ligase [Acidobacteriaceae bacterium]|nr:pantoate--beta-alanine ligase [Acidobacteriaceae bacterium]
MRIVADIPETRSAIRQLRAAQASGTSRSVGFVPTMGALHEGHRSLVRAARRRCDVVVASIFVNPTQFGPNEDFTRYPRTLEADCRMLEEEGADLVFTPSAEGMYPAGSTTLVEVAGVGDRLDGASRPGHFRGVATVVAKLIHIVQPEFAFFGQKDAAQLAVLRQMVRDLHIPVELVACPIVREPDGLAMSSRNRYLSAEERGQALAIWRGLETARRLVQSGEHCAEVLLRAVRDAVEQEPALREDYLALVDPDTLLPVASLQNGGLLAVAVYAGTTRLIDNMLLPRASASSQE